MIIAVDFDKTLHTGRWPDIGVPVPWAADALGQLREKGHYLIIWTCRSGDNLLKMVNWLVENGMPFDRINDNHPKNVATFGNNSRKVCADLYIDDKQYGGLPTVGGFPDWQEIAENIINLKTETWN